MIHSLTCLDLLDGRQQLYQIQNYNYVWEAQTVQNENIFLSRYIQRLKYQYRQNWRETCIDSRKLCTYKDFKIEFGREPYIYIIDIGKFRKCMANFRFSGHNLMIEKGRHYSILLEDRNCVYCEECLEDEFHFVLICPLYSEVRSKYIKENYVLNATFDKFCNLMSTSNANTIRNLAMYLYYAFEVRNDFLQGTE